MRRGSPLPRGLSGKGSAGRHRAFDKADRAATVSRLYAGGHTGAAHLGFGFRAKPAQGLWGLDFAPNRRGGFRGCICVQPCVLSYIISAISIASRARGGRPRSPRGLPPLDSPIPWLCLCLRDEVNTKLFIFGCGNILFLSARSVSSRAALRPERAVLNQPEFQGWIVRGWEIAFCRLICAQEPILAAPYVVFRLCEVDSSCA